MRPTKFYRSLLAACVFVAAVGTAASQERRATGVVFDDANRNGHRDATEEGIAGVLVSNQLDVVKTDAAGRYRLPVRNDETVLFVIQPPGFLAPVNEDNLLQFYYIHQPGGSGPLQYAGVEPTGPLPPSVDFPLHKTTASDTFDVLIFTDPQPRSMQEIDYIRDDVVAELVGSKAFCGITLGDIMYNDLSLFGRYNAIVGKIGIPFFNVPGNHDMNFDSPDDRHSLETFKRFFGPTYYAFEHGKVNFIMLDTVEWLGPDSSGTGHYQGRLGETQLRWIENYLNFVPADHLLVFGMHIPFYFSGNKGWHVNVLDRQALFALLQGRKHVLALAGHLHMLEHDRLDTAFAEMALPPFPQIICAAVSGSWWSGPKDERGIPTTDQRDGTPNGYHIFHFSGNRFTQRFQAAGRGGDYQIRISAPRGVLKQSQLDSALILANVFNAGADFVTRYEIDGGGLHEMQRARMKDPFMVELQRKFTDTYREWIRPQPSTHVWTAPLPTDLKAGPHTLLIRSTDGHNVFVQTAVFEVR